MAYIIYRKFIGILTTPLTLQVEVLALLHGMIPMQAFYHAIFYNPNDHKGPKRASALDISLPFNTVDTLLHGPKYLIPAIFRYYSIATWVMQDFYDST